VYSDIVVGYGFWFCFFERKKLQAPPKCVIGFVPLMNVRLVFYQEHGPLNFDGGLQHLPMNTNCPNFSGFDCHKVGKFYLSAVVVTQESV